jgi:hypothetical protein
MTDRAAADQSREASNDPNAQRRAGFDKITPVVRTHGE